MSTSRAHYIPYLPINTFYNFYCCCYQPDRTGRMQTENSISSRSRQRYRKFQKKHNLEVKKRSIRSSPHNHAPVASKTRTTHKNGSSDLIGWMIQPTNQPSRSNQSADGTARPTRYTCLIENVQNEQLMYVLVLQCRCMYIYYCAFRSARRLILLQLI